MTATTAGARVQTPDGPGYVYALDGDYTAVVLDKHAGRTNAPIYWARLGELAPVIDTPAPAPCNHDAALGELQGMTVSGDACTRCGAVQW